MFFLLLLLNVLQGICAQTFYGHHHSCNHVRFSFQGDTLASCDSYGVVKLWDIRTVSVYATIDVGSHPANQVAFDTSGKSIIFRKRCLH